MTSHKITWVIFQWIIKQDIRITIKSLETGASLEFIVIFTILIHFILFFSFLEGHFVCIPLNCSFLGLLDFTHL